MYRGTIILRKDNSIISSKDYSNNVVLAFIKFVLDVAKSARNNAELYSKDVYFNFYKVR